QGVERRRDDAHAERLGRGAGAEGRRRTEVEVDAGARAARVGEAVERCARRGWIARRERPDVARRERLGEELLRPRRAGREEEERRADRAALAGGTVRVERVRRAGGGDGRALRVRDVRERRRVDPGRRVVFEAGNSLSPLEVADEGEETPVDLLLPRD